MGDVPSWVAAAAQQVAVLERTALSHLHTAEAPSVDDVDATHAVIRLARGIRRKLEWWQKRHLAR